jgi:DNA polymerase IV
MITLCRDCCETFGGEHMRCPNCRSARCLRHAEVESLWLAHLDCDAFYASVEKRDDPSLRDRPLIVGGGQRGVVSTCCYLARRFGVRSAMPMARARRLCPEAVILKPNFTKYRAASRAIFAMARDLTPLVQPLALDEAWLDLSGTERLHGAAPAVVLARLQNRIETEVGVTASIGLAPNKFLAKIASDLDKPRGFAVIGVAEAKAFLADKPVGLLPGVGPALVASLERAGYRRIGELAVADPKALAARFGKSGAHLHRLANGEDGRQVNPREARKSISAETTFFEDLSAPDALKQRLLALSERVAHVARKEQLAGRAVTLKLKTSGFKLITRRRTLPRPTQTAHAVFGVSSELLDHELSAGPFRLIGVGLSEFNDDGDPADDLFGDDSDTRALAEERAIDQLRDRFGASIVVRARLMGRMNTDQVENSQPSAFDL